MINLLYIILATVILILICCIIGYFFTIAFVRKNNPNVDDLNSKQNEFLLPYKDVLKKGMEFLNNTEHEGYTVTSFDRLKLYADYYNNNSNKTILLFHGYRSSARHDFSCAVKMYYDMGFNVLLVHQRSHGLSQGKLITFGVKESRDVVTWVDFLNENFKVDNIVLSGLSMGATTVLLSLKYKMPDNVKCVIADCGFTSPEEIIKKVSKQAFKINATFFIPILDFLCKAFGKFSIRKISTVDIVKQSNIPVMLIHGKCDNFVPCEMSQEVYDSSKEKVKLVLVAGADHGISFLVDTNLVLSNLKEFLDKNLS